MKTFASTGHHIRSHTWRDIGGVLGLVLDFGFFLFVLMGAAVMIVIGFIALMIDYMLQPILALVSLIKRKSEELRTSPQEDIVYPF